MTNYLMNTYNPLPVAFVRGEGVWLWDTTGKQYLDAMAGIAVSGLGHHHPAVTQAIVEQAQLLLHTANVCQIPYQQQLAENLCRLAKMDRAFFSNSGAEANEAALKLARLYGHKKNIENPEIIVMENAFHGRTLATLSASGSRKVQAGFEPLVRGFIRAPFNDIQAIETIAHNSQTHGKSAIVAVMVEPVQGEGGVMPASDHYLVKLREICDANGWLLILDEIQTGVGRTGEFYAFQHTSIRPDILTTAKALGNGIPIAACLARGIAAALFQPGNHGSTFGGNPFACRVANTVLSVIEKENICDNVKQRSAQLLSGLKKALSVFPAVKDIRGKGLMLGIELDRPCRDLLSFGLKESILMNVTAEKVVRLLPPLIISEQEVDILIERVMESMRAYLAQS